MSPCPDLRLVYFVDVDGADFVLQLGVAVFAVQRCADQQLVDAVAVDVGVGQRATEELTRLVTVQRQLPLPQRPLGRPRRRRLRPVLGLIQHHHLRRIPNRFNQW